MINFLKYTKLYAFISILVISVGMTSLFMYGPKLSIDFTGGAILNYSFNKPVSEGEVVNILVKNSLSIVDESRQSPTRILIRTKLISDEKEALVRKDLEKKLGVKIKLLRFETVGPTLGEEVMRKTLAASFVAIIGILLYLTFAFKRMNYGVAAVVAMFHDFLVVVGCYSIISHFFGAEMDTLFVTALLTTLSFSVHDTIVVFDKIREHEKYSSLPLTIMANKAFTETVVRSVNNSLTIVLMLVPLMIFGGSSIRFFAVALLIGTITGMYSSPFVATPFLVFLESRRKVK